MNAIFEKWALVATEGTKKPARPYGPLHVVLKEAIELAAFCQSYYEPVVNELGAVTRPGLKFALNGGRFRPELGSEILELQEAASVAQRKYALLVPNTQSPMVRAKYVLGELVAGLDFLLNNDVENVDRQRLANLAQAHDTPSSQDAMALALDDYAAFAKIHLEPLSTIAAFETSVVVEGSALAGRLRQHSAKKVAGTANGEQREALRLRNQLVALLCQRTQLVRSAARYVFRHQPDIARRVASDYLRQKNARYRRERTLNASRASALSKS